MFGTLSKILIKCDWGKFLLKHENKSYKKVISNS